MKLGALIVTFNRLEMLKKLLHLYDNQNNEIDVLVIVNNNSIDGTKEFLENYNFKIKGVKTINLEKNMGGSGGFYTGLNYMKDLDLDWIYLSDDDAFFEENIFLEFKSKIEKKDKSKYSAICTSVINNGKYDLNHRRNFKKKFLKIIEEKSTLKDYSKEEFELNLYSYVGIFLNKNKLQPNNLPEKDYFIWYDDTEHSIQMSKLGKIICWPSLRVHHDTEESSNSQINWKSYYGMRNRLLAYRKHFGILVFLRYFMVGILRGIIKLMMQKTSLSKLIVHSCLDALKGKQGIHRIYKPGWK